MIPPRENPFRVDRVSTLPFIGANVPALAEAFLKLGRAAIVGQHGTGKSTLLRTLGDYLTEAGYEVKHISLPGSATAAERRAALNFSVGARPASPEGVDCPSRATQASPLQNGEVVLFDGFEQLGWLQRRRVLRWPRLLVTAHAPTRLPTLITLKPTLAELDRVIERLLPDADAEVRSFARAAFVRHRGDVRATLFDLYDAVSVPSPVGTRGRGQKAVLPGDDDGGRVVV
ncbi:MAG: ATP-binding protein [Tepidisphaeraceae bacterium]